MNRRISLWHPLTSAHGFTIGLLAAFLLGPCGCATPQIRSQSEEETPLETKYDVKTVGDVTDVGNAQPMPVGGVGLVVGLEGTGGPTPAGEWVTMLQEELKRKSPRELRDLLASEGVKDTKELLASPNISLVLVSAEIPPGARKNDTLDVDVSVVRGSRTTSLRGGYLKECVLYNYDFARNLSPNFAQSDQALKGHPVARAEGPLLVGFADGDDAARVKQARIWGGARCKLPRPFYLMLKSDQQYARVAKVVADRVNETFHTAALGVPGEEMAKAMNNSVVVLNVPPQYRHNLPRYLRVVRLVPLRENPDALHDNHAASAGKASAPANSYRQRLEQDLLDPVHTVTAALRLEALGQGSLPALKAGLQHEHPLVRFCSAEALAYLDSPAGGEELAKMIEQHAALRAFRLTALASMDQAISHVKLRDLLASPQPETRYGAFRALRALDEHDPAVQGELLNQSFWLHRVMPATEPLVHISSSRRAEVVLFGQEPMLVPPFQFQAGEFTVTAGAENEEHCTVSRFSLQRGARETRQCPLSVEDMLRTLAGLGGTYAEVVELLRQAKTCQCVSCPVEVDQLPQALSVYELARAGRASSDLLTTDAEILNARPDFGATPTLYQKDGVTRKRSDVEQDEEAMLRDRNGKDDGKRAQRKGQGEE
jgi:hypothetical protein